VILTLLSALWSLLFIVLIVLSSFLFRTLKKQVPLLHRLGCTKHVLKSIRKDAKMLRAAEKSGTPCEGG